MVRCLREAFRGTGHYCAFWFAFDIAGEPRPASFKERTYLFSAQKGRLHVHGVLDCPETMEKAARQALHNVNSNRYPANFKQFAVRFDKPASALGWAEYCLKDRAFIRLFFQDHSPLRVDNDTRRVAKRLYQEFRSKGRLVSLVDLANEGRCRLIDMRRLPARK
jgi:hypothetical protein